MFSHAHIVNSGVKGLEEISANISKFASANLKIKVSQFTFLSQGLHVPPTYFHFVYIYEYNE